jgi:hypothetical protein
MFRFTIRDVLWLTVVVALSVGWWVNQARLRAENRALVSKAGKQEARADAAIVLARKCGIDIEWDQDGTMIRYVRLSRNP